jgi:hypothetical protein
MIGLKAELLKPGLDCNNRIGFFESTASERGSKLRTIFNRIHWLETPARHN